MTNQCDTEYDIRAFVDEHGRGGNRTIVLDWQGAMDEAYATEVARRIGGESTSIVRSERATRVRFFLATGEMAFCGHGLLGAAAVLAHSEPSRNTFPVLIGDNQHELLVSDRQRTFIEVVSALGVALPVPHSSGSSVFAALGLSRSCGTSWPIVNAGTDRPKTLVPVKSIDILQAIKTSEKQVADACVQLGTTGLFPFVHCRNGLFEARQFPANAGFLEDSASGTAAIALASAYGVIYPADDGERALHIRQGAAMGKASELFVRWRSDGRVALGGRVRMQ